ncbi:HAD family hydrolase [Tautonia sociabilis]|uniref:HAD family hydrolase n=2 Tax=Tautonia sociabilis TaxID=2080755 RepID=A0A432MNT4_9BACT|nr:HAD family hydrolase [Tautonia sociabilis]
MWSGPRNISTAMMRSWGNRPDTAVCDEPLYAFYLKETGLDHPGAAEVIAHHEADWRKVVEQLVGPVPGGRAIFYQKQMAHHLLPSIDRSWLDRVTNAFLIREPREMLTSLLKVLPEPRLEDTGLPQQVEIFNRVRERTGAVPPVVDAKDVLDDPRGMLAALCRSLGVPFDDRMLSWPPGPRETDGIWAKYWYDSVERSTGFQPYTPKPDAVPDRLLGVLERAEDCYATLFEHRLLP